MNTSSSPGDTPTEEIDKPLPLTLGFVPVLGGALLFVSVLMFVYVAVGTRLQNERAAEPAQFRAVALALAVLAYVGPLRQQFAQPHYLAPGMRTW